jgi:Fe-S-cluster-containing dehydrogenase component/CRP-like cAMP-binding protein
MPEAPVKMARPQRWDVPFDPDMTDATVDHLLATEPFKSIDAGKFPASLPLRGILANDTRVVRFRSGDLVVREGDYGGSAFLILNGAVRVTLQSLPGKLLGRRERRAKGVFSALSKLWTNSRLPEVRDYTEDADQQQVGKRTGGDKVTRVFLQDVPGVLQAHKTIRLESGQMFGELAALTRSARTATIFADGEAELLEIRWQGLRDLLRRADALKAHVDRLYRERSLKVQLRATPLLARLTDLQLQSVAAATEFGTYGNFDWQTAFDSASQRDAAERLAAEPVIAEEGHYVNGLILIRSGFARVSCRFGSGHRTFSYLGKGQAYGLEELAHNWRAARSGSHTVPMQRTLRAVGYVDILRIPTPIVEQYILPTLDESQLPPMFPPPAGPEDPAPLPARAKIDIGLMEFLVENRFINGRATMLINTDRCTRCDDCVRACSNAHDGNPRFTRHGRRFGRHMIANACMHCADPVCMIGCPTGAIHRDAATGNVVINDDTCIGCATCANSCPYENIRMVEVRGLSGQLLLDDATNHPIRKATKCDLCIDELGGPACQRACPHDALKRVDMHELDTLARNIPPAN